MVRLFDLIKSGMNILKNSNTPQLDAEVILSHVLNTDRLYLYLNREKNIDDTITEKFNALIERRKHGEPIAYITGVREFMGLTFVIKPGVLIPRGDTEILVEEVINTIGGYNNPMVVDIGCGSGAIAVSIAKNVKTSQVFALDIMDIPLEITRLNAVENGVSERVHVLKSNILNALGKEHENTIDAIVSNPPYIEDAVIPNLMMDVKNYEPKIALSGGADGLDYYRTITKDCIIYLKDEGLLAYEIGYNQAVGVMDIMRAEGFYNIKLIKDLGGNDRVVLGRVKKA